MSLGVSIGQAAGNTLALANPVTPATDPSYSGVMVHLNGEGGALGQGNQTFLDSSVNTAAVTTTSGMVTQGTLSPYTTPPLGGSGYFGPTILGGITANTPILTVPYNANVGTSDFTIECWINLSAIPTSGYVFYSGNGSGANPKIYLQVTTGGVLTFGISATGTTPIASSASGTVVISTWYHIAMVRLAGVCTLYVNGVSVATGTYATAVTGITHGFEIGNTAGTDLISAGYYAGYLAGLRFVNGTALYTTTFVPPTSAPTAVTNTGLLMNFNNAGIADQSRHTYVYTTNPLTTNDTIRFGTEALYFDGATAAVMPQPLTGNILAGDFTIEMWVNFKAIVGTQQVAIFAQWYPPPSANTQGFALVSDNATPRKFNWYWGPISISAVQITSVTPVAVGRWQHVALSRTGNVISMFVDGVLQGTCTGTLMVSSGASQSVPWSIGQYFNSSGVIPAVSVSYLNGFIDELKVTKGVGKWTASFVPPLAPTMVYDTIASTFRDQLANRIALQLDFNGTNTSTSILDASVNAIPVTATGAAQLSTTAPYLGSAKLSLDGTTATCVTTGYASKLALSNASDWCVDFYVMRTSSSGALNSTLFCEAGATGASYAAGLHMIMYMVNATGQIVFEYANGTTSTDLPAAGFIPLNVWTHVALVYIGAMRTFRLFINGFEVQNALVSDFVAGPSSTRITVGAVDAGFTGTRYEAVANMDRFRITQGLQRYVTNFIPDPTTFVDQYASKNLGLYHMESLADSSPNNNALVLNTSGALSTTQAKFGAQSLFCPLSGSTISGATTTNTVTLGTADFTMECWGYMTAYGASSVTQWLFNTQQTTQNDLNGFAFCIDDTGKSVEFQIGTTNTIVKTIVAATTVPLNVWHHFAVTRAGNVFSAYIDGLFMGSVTNTIDLQARPITIGGLPFTIAGPTNSRPWLGYIDEVRITPGVARYTANFFVPTAPFSST